MKKNTTYVAREKFEAIISAKGLQFEEQAGFLKIVLKGGCRLYVARTKSVGRVDIGWDCDLPGVRALGGESFGQIHHQMDFHRSEEEILKTFEAVLDHGMDLKPRPVKKVSPKAAQGATAQPLPNASSPSPEERKALIEKVAKEKNVAVSKNANV